MTGSCLSATTADLAAAREDSKPLISELMKIFTLVPPLFLVGVMIHDIHLYIAVQAARQPAYLQPRMLERGSAISHGAVI